MTIQKLCPRCRRVYIPHYAPRCPECEKAYRAEKSEAQRRRNRRYDNTKRDPELTAFYHSTEWKKLRLYKINKHFICEVCGKRPAVDVHHIIPVREDWEKRLDFNNLQSVCASCHYAHHHAGKPKPGTE